MDRMPRWAVSPRWELRRPLRGTRAMPLLAATARAAVIITVGTPHHRRALTITRQWRRRARTSRPMASGSDTGCDLYSLLIQIKTCSQAKVSFHCAIACFRILFMTTTFVFFYSQQLRAIFEYDDVLVLVFLLYKTTRIFFVLRSAHTHTNQPTNFIHLTHQNCALLL